jgi:GDP-4-dehydro-6-deoxy-D-mannose reductase
VRILVTGSSGFVGRWLTAELVAHGHEVVPTPDPPELEISDPDAVFDLVARTAPDGVIHLAAVAFAADAAADAVTALRVNVGGTQAVLDACQAVRPGMAVLVVGSSEVYRPPQDGLPLTEASPVEPRAAYGLTKLAAEALTLSAGAGGELRVAVARSFNHTGPGQRGVFAIPAFAGRILEARRAGVHRIRAGNVDVARDFGDVRDVARAYRLLIEALASDRVTLTRPVFNVASGRSTTVRSAIEKLGELAGWPVEIEVDPALVRPDDPPIVWGDASRLRELTGWAPQIPLEQTLADLLESLEPATA